MIIDPPPPFNALWFRFLIGFVIGAVLGSFATMLVYRLPRRLSIITAHSRCPICLTDLGIHDLVPIISWLATRGHCRYCQAKISNYYLIIELLTGLACALVTAVLGITPFLLAAYTFILLLVVFISIELLKKK